MKVKLHLVSDAGVALPGVLMHFSGLPQNRFIPLNLPPTAAQGNNEVILMVHGRVLTAFRRFLEQF
jgi:hypothetical protein